ncbi:hypothetical protein ACFQFR_22660 [Streptomyces goshikiensis]
MASRAPRAAARTLSRGAQAAAMACASSTTARSRPSTPITPG